MRPGYEPNVEDKTDGKESVSDGDGNGSTGEAPIEFLQDRC